MLWHWQWVSGTRLWTVTSHVITIFLIKNFYLKLFFLSGKSVRYTQGLYFRMKDSVFLGRRPYDEKPLEEILKKELGEETVMADIKEVKYAVVGDKS